MTASELRASAFIGVCPKELADMVKRAFIRERSTEIHYRINGADAHIYLTGVVDSETVKHNQNFLHGFVTAHNFQSITPTPVTEPQYELKKSVDSLYQRTDTLMKKLDTLDELATGRLNELENIVSLNMASINALDACIRVAQKDILDIRNHLTLPCVKCGIADANMTIHTEQIACLQHSLNQVSESVANQHDSIDKLWNTIRTVTSSIVDQQQEIGGLTDSVSALKYFTQGG